MTGGWMRKWKFPETWFSAWNKSSTKRLCKWVLPALCWGNSVRNSSLKSRPLKKSSQSSGKTKMGTHALVSSSKPMSMFSSSISRMKRSTFEDQIMTSRRKRNLMITKSAKERNFRSISRCREESMMTFTTLAVTMAPRVTPLIKSQSVWSIRSFSTKLDSLPHLSSEPSLPLSSTHSTTTTSRQPSRKIR